ncbi:hypothetical protein LTS18_014788, partial [Coniosporium uncinatum]
MYFDDGLIEDPAEEDADRFDESVFDDPNHSLYERKAVEPRSIRDDTTTLQGTEEDEDEGNTDQVQRKGTLHALHGRLEQDHHEDLGARFDNLEAYHSALASAANKAEADGRFRRFDSVREDATAQDEPPTVSSRPSLVPDDNRSSNESNLSPPTGLGIDGFETESYHMAKPSIDGDLSLDFEGSNYDESVFDDFGSYGQDVDDYDSALEDDPIIAAANAEALAADDAGFYGQEFGFYAKPTTNSKEAELFQGGYFGPKGVDTIQRQKSLREPNLTPITERSEFSTRNSFVSLHNHFLSSGALPSPGLAQLRAQAERDPNVMEDDMTLSQLIKLRRGAFGSNPNSGSGASPYSSSPVGRSSPMAYTFPNSSPSPVVVGVGVSPTVPGSGGIPALTLEEDEESYDSDE